MDSKKLVSFEMKINEESLQKLEKYLKENQISSYKLSFKKELISKEFQTSSRRRVNFSQLSEYVQPSTSSSNSTKKISCAIDEVKRLNQLKHIASVRYVTERNLLRRRSSYACTIFAIKEGVEITIKSKFCSSEFLAKLTVARLFLINIMNYEISQFEFN